MPRGTSQYDAANIERRLWTPELVPTDVWYDASDYATLVWDAKITTLKDKSLNARDLNQTTVSNQPDWQENTFNTKPSLYFDGTSDRLSLSSSIPWTTSHSFIWVGQMIETPNVGSAFFNGNNNTEGPNNYNGGVYWWTVASGDILQSANTMDSNANIVSITRSSSTWNFYKNGTSQTISLGTSGTASFQNLGQAYTGYSNMRVAEFFMYPRSLELWNISKAEGYAARKWNMVNSLNPSHTYKNKPALRDAG